VAGLGSASLLSACGAVETPSRSSFGKPVAGFPDTRWDPTSKTGGKKPNLPKRMAYQNIVVGATTLEIVDKWMKTAAKEVGYDYLSSNSNANPAQTITQIKSAIGRGVMGIVSPGDDQKAVAAAMRTGMDKGAAMFLFNGGGITCGMAAVQYGFGHSQGKAAAQHILDKFGGDAQILYINGDANVTLRPREKGFKDALTEAGVDLGQYKSVPAPAGGTQKAGFDIMNSFLQTNPHVNVVAGVSDDIAIGAMGSLKSAGKWTSTKDLFVCGADGSAEALGYIQKSGTPFGATSAAHFPLAGYAPGRLIERWGNGDSIPQYLEYNSFQIDSPDAAASFLKDQDRCKELYEQMLDGDDTYITPRGEITFETHDAYYSGELLEKLPPVQS
jgi:ABC-type sugar transport system substrate-binding protein